MFRIVKMDYSLIPFLDICFVDKFRFVDHP